VELPVLQVHGTAVVRLSGKGGFYGYPSHIS
jgi:hypothetical protein